MVDYLSKEFKVFQSTPLPTGRSDQRSGQLLMLSGGFNPRPSQPEGATERGWSVIQEGYSFNPRPSQPEGATRRREWREVGRLVSIHAPPNRKERQRQSLRCPQTGRVSIHAPPNRKERHWTRRGMLSSSSFQSTPLPTGRSDRQRQGATSDKRGFNPRPSQPEGATLRGHPSDAAS